jgi:hypothetical protein
VQSWESPFFSLFCGCCLNRNEAKNVQFWKKEKPKAFSNDSHYCGSDNAAYHCADSFHVKYTKNQTASQIYLWLCTLKIKAVVLELKNASRTTLITMEWGL